MICGTRHSLSAPLACAASRLAAALGLAALTLNSAVAVPGPANASSNFLFHAGWPLFFEAGPVPSNGPASFLARAPNYQFVIAPDEVNFVFRKPQLAPPNRSVQRDESIAIRGGPPRFVRMSFTAANPDASISGAGKLDGKVNYLIGNDPARWRAGVPMFAQVKVEALYPGVDVVYYANHEQLEYDFTIAPKADAAAIALRFEGVDRLSINPQGELVIGLGDAQLRQHRPRIYQIVQGTRKEISGGYQLKDSRTIAFAVGPYDHDLPLIIDPIFSYSTYFGGNRGDTGLAIKVDNSGSVYLAGETLSTQFPFQLPTNSFQSSNHGGSQTGDAFVAKLDSTGSKLIYFTYLGGSGDDGAYDMAVDAAGDAYLTGFTVSPDFPTNNALFGKINGSPDPTVQLYPLDAFVTELSPDGSSLIYSTYLGGTDKDVGSAIAVDLEGNAYVTGLTYSTNFPVQNALQDSLAGLEDVFVAKLAPGGTNLVYSTYFGGVASDEGEGIAVDANGSAYVAGYTDSSDFPVTPNAAQTNLNISGIFNGYFDAFVTRFAPDGQSLVYSTYLGGSLHDYGYRIAVDQFDNAYVTGATESPEFPHTNLFNLTFGQNGTNTTNFDAFLTKLDPGGTPVYSAQFGGTSDDAGWDVAVDSSGRAFVVGITLSVDFPVVAPFDLFRTNNSGGKDVFVVAFQTNAAPVLYSAYLGGASDDFGYAIAVDAEDSAYISGLTFSTAFPTTVGPLQGGLDGSSAAFVAKIRLIDPILAVQTLTNSVVLTWPATAPDYVLQSTTGLAPPLVWTAVPQMPVLTNGEYLVNLAVTNSSTLFRLSRP
jgi:hypothetical protein